MKIEVSLNTSSVQNSINFLKYMQKSFPIMIDEFCRNSLSWISERANDYLDERSNGFNTSNIRFSWYQEKISEGYYKLINLDDISVYAEFGTGLEGQKYKHKVANKVGYEYDVNSHGEDGWTFYNKEQNLYLRGFVGYKGHSFLYNSYWDYFFKEKKYIEIWQKIVNKYLDKFITKKGN